MSRWPDPDTQLERALVRGAAEAGIALHVESAASTPWASVTFTGARHRLRAVAPASPALISGWQPCPKQSSACAVISLPIWP
ncbi:hypothetical protein DdX_20964 [Ditylenchus destructor]|uniref:Uncharacterized protein n=1 Tax=Ditylenchus destructor TaxID=166010 RepID=A0AAD4MGD8_9BILA|nr:hypothetical protein DdX_20964 [Ditylenchus destructor]